MRARVEGGRELRGRSLLVALLLLALLPACSGRGTTAAPAADARDAAGGCASASEPRSGNKRSRFREMTWEEYYTEVRERAWRNAATIIWITPPNVRRRRPEPAATTSSASSGANGANTTACAR